MAEEEASFRDDPMSDLASLLLDAVVHALFEMFVRASGPGTNHGHIQVTMLDHMIKEQEIFSCEPSPPWLRIEPGHRLAL